MTSANGQVFLHVYTRVKIDGVTYYRTFPVIPGLDLRTTGDLQHDNEGLLNDFLT